MNRTILALTTLAALGTPSLALADHDDDRRYGDDRYDDRYQDDDRYRADDDRYERNRSRGAALIGIVDADPSNGRDVVQLGRMGRGVDRLELTVQRDEVPLRWVNVRFSDGFVLTRSFANTLAPGEKVTIDLPARGAVTSVTLDYSKSTKYQRTADDGRIRVVAVDHLPQDRYDRRGFDQDGYDRDGLDRDGYGRDGYDLQGFNRDGRHRDGHVRNERSRALRDIKVKRVYRVRR